MNRVNLRLVKDVHTGKQSVLLMDDYGTGCVDAPEGITGEATINELFSAWVNQGNMWWRGGQLVGFSEKTCYNYIMDYHLSLQYNDVIVSSGEFASLISKLEIAKFIPHIIKNKKLYGELLNAEKNNESLWSTLFNDYELKDSDIPVLWGGLDHIEHVEDGFIFHDIGTNGKDNSFMITE